MNPLDATHAGKTESRTAEACTTCGSRVAGLCHRLDASALDDIASDSQRFHLPAKSTLFREGDPASRAISIIEGVVKLSRLLPDGKQQVVGFRFAGDLLGYGAGKTYPFDAESLTPGHFCRIERGRLDAMLRLYPQMERRLLDLCLRELSNTQDQLVTVGRRSAEARVASFLIGLTEAHRQRGALPADLPMPMTRSDIGDFLGLTLETVSRSFAAFKRQKLIAEPGHQTVRILDMDALLRMTEGEPAEL
ncbi:Crp/Fnr family transcriptional regulator [Sediminicoccus sp. KRV36]|uniref:Crp/Fnr family transcriptional regulator n=1 Tax=Sediminicoccus sp. KRV36 TaxID=3133721 RepID=UPI00200CAECD|nr:Crp/Fnr family transcriptional regulator [Sediminicoccus rosea]UPY36305.1 Crp/Fnr family transcriptional regulator [Sediminicoccus rosea]